MKIKIEELKKVKLNPGDVVLVTLSNDTTEDELQYNHEIFGEAFPKNKVIFRNHECKIDIVTHK